MILNIQPPLSLLSKQNFPFLLFNQNQHSKFKTPNLTPSDMSKPRQEEQSPRTRAVKIRSVWAENLEYEFSIIRSVIDDYPVISMDTEFPGVVVRNQGEDNPNSLYVKLKANVDLLNLIQIGITLSDHQGNLPHLGSPHFSFIWEFNFNDFDIARDAHAHDSVELLKRQGIDFEKNREFGVESVKFAELMMSSGLVLNDSVSWVTFHCAYDFGYLVKCLTQKLLPGELGEFVGMVRMFFGERVYDVKHVMRSGNLYGGLDRVCMSLGVERVAGKSHQAGSDSLMTLHAFLRIKERFLSDDGELGKFANVLYGLELRNDNHKST